MAYVQCSDSTLQTVIAVFACPQDDTNYPNQTTLEETDSRYLAFIDPTSTLAGAQASKLDELKSAFLTASTASVTDSNGVTWNGGISSAQTIKSLVDLASETSDTSIDIYDINNQSHTVTLAQGTAVAVTIGQAYQVVYVKYQALKNQVAAATTVDAVNAITWS